MKIHIRARDIEVTKALREHVELRLGFALSRFGEHIGRVSVHLSNSEEKRNGGEKLCRIKISVPRWFKVQEADADVFAAVARAADKAARATARMLEKADATALVLKLKKKGSSGPARKSRRQPDV